MTNAAVAVVTIIIFIAVKEFVAGFCCYFIFSVFTVVVVTLLIVAIVFLDVSDDIENHCLACVSYLCECLIISIASKL